MKQTEIVTHVTHVNGWEEIHEPKFQFVSRIEVIRSNFSIFFLLMYPWSEPVV